MEKKRPSLSIDVQPQLSLSNIKILLALSAALLLGATAQAKFPAEGLVKTASSGVIQGKAVLMKADSADLHDSKLARIRSNKFIASMAKKDSGAS